MSLIQAATELEMSVTTLRRRIAAGEIKPVPTPGTLKRPKVMEIEAAEIQRYKREHGG